MATTEDNITTSYTYTIGQSAEILDYFSQRTVCTNAAYLLPHVQPDSHILDVGCGPGSITIDLASRCPTGRVIGIDRDGAAIAAARRAAAAAAAGGKDHKKGSDTEFVQADCTTRLPFDDASFDIVHGHQVAQFIADVPAALAEWRRVLRPGGLLALSTIWVAGIVASPPHVTGFGSLVRAVNGAFRATGGDPSVLQHVRQIAPAAGFVESLVSMHPHVIVDEAGRQGVVRFMLNDEMVAGWRVQGIVSEDEIIDIGEALASVLETESGFFILPTIEIICRASNNRASTNK